MNLAEKLSSKSPDPDTLSILHYIKDLSHQTNFPIDDWDIDEIFGEGKKGRLVQTPQEANKRFFQKVKNKKPFSQVKIDLSAEQEKVLQEIQTVYANEKEKIVKHEIATKRSSLSTLCKSAEQICKDLAVLYERTTATKDVKEELRQILSIGFYKFHAILGPQQGRTTPLIQLVTDPIILSYRRGDGVLLKMAMGQYLVEFYPTAAVCYIRPFKDNIMTDSKYSPFISSNGEICFGSAKEAAMLAIAQGKYFEYFQLLYSLLTTFSSENTPYASFEQFFTKGFKQDGSRPWREEMEPNGQRAEPEDREDGSDDDDDVEEDDYL